MQKYRVACPYCESHLLVTEDLLGQPGECPACRKEFLLPSVDAFLVVALPRDPVPSSPATPAGSSVPDELFGGSTDGLLPFPPPPPFADPTQPSTTDGAAPRRRPKPVKIISRRALGVLSTLLKVVAALLVLTGCVLLLTIVLLSVGSPVPPLMVIAFVGGAICIGAAAVPVLAFAELLHIWMAQEEMLRHIVNHLREKD